MRGRNATYGSDEPQTSDDDDATNSSGQQNNLVPDIRISTATPAPRRESLGDIFNINPGELYEDEEKMTESTTEELRPKEPEITPTIPGPMPTDSGANGARKGLNGGGNRQKRRKITKKGGANDYVKAFSKETDFLLLHQTTLRAFRGQLNQEAQNIKYELGDDFGLNAFVYAGLIFDQRHILSSQHYLNTGLKIQDTLTAAGFRLRWIFNSQKYQPLVRKDQLKSLFASKIPNIATENYVWREDAQNAYISLFYGKKISGYVSFMDLETKTKQPDDVNKVLNCM